MRILIVEDDTDTRQFIARGLAEAGHQVATAADGHDGLVQATADAYDVIVLDRRLPKLDGLALLKMLRAGGCRAQVLLLTALGGLEDRVEGLESGADDYLVKPFAFAELIARVHALGRRPAVSVESRRLRVADLALDLERRTVTRAGRPIALQPREFAILTELLRHPDRVVTRTMLLDRVWGFAFDPKTSIVETHISRLRAKLNAGFATDAIDTLRGAGYTVRSA